MRIHMFAIFCLVLFLAAPLHSQEWKPLGQYLNSGPTYTGPTDGTDDGRDVDDQGYQPLETVPMTRTPTPIRQNAEIPDPLTLQPSPLTPREMQYARTAWAYFEQNTHPVTGLVPSVRKFKSMTLWDEGGYFLALVSAYKLGIISRGDAVNRLTTAISSLAALPLYKGIVPNKAYNIEQLIMTDYANKPRPKGIGYSALDIMRLMSGMLVASQQFPELFPLIQLLVQRWDLDALALNNRFAGVALLQKKYARRVQEGRIGYEQYAGVTGTILGLPVKQAYQYAPILRWQQYFDIRLPADKRTAKTHGVSAVTTSEPFLLEALEYGWRTESYPVASAVFAAQLFRYQQSGQLTALSEDHIKGPPYFAYNGILVDFEPFKSVTASRKDVSDKRGISAKASFGWWAVTRHPYTEKLLAEIEQLQTPQGWMAGLFEADMSKNEILTLNTNAMILEALHYKAFGPLYKF
tara:strand:- start:3693 stop:5084 length:1392 start_codon:yes stop_codon:yes gene_type:complete